MKTISEYMNQIRENQAKLVELNDRMAQYNGNADNDGANIRIEIINEMRKTLNEIEEASNAIKNY